MVLWYWKHTNFCQIDTRICKQYWKCIICNIGIKTENYVFFKNQYRHKKLKFEPCIYFNVTYYRRSLGVMEDNNICGYKKDKTSKVVTSCFQFFGTPTFKLSQHPPHKFKSTRLLFSDIPQHFFTSSNTFLFFHIDPYPIKKLFTWWKKTMIILEV